MVKTATAKMTAQDTAAIIVKTALEKEEQIEILMGKGLNRVQAQATLATAAHTAATTGATTATGLFTGAIASAKIAIKGLTAAIASNPIGALIVGASILIPIITKIVSSIKEAKQKVKEAAQEAKSAIDDIKSEFENLSDKTDDIKERFAELAQGVENLGKVNQSRGKLSTEDYNEFLELSNQLAELYPQLTKGYDDNGNAILSLTGNVNTITSALENLLTTQRKIANQKILENMSDVWAGYQVDLGEFKNALSEATAHRQALLNTVSAINNKSILTLHDIKDKGFTADKEADTLLQEVFRSLDINYNYGILSSKTERVMGTGDITDHYATWDFSLLSDDEIEKLKSHLDLELNSLVSEYNRTIELTQNKIDSANSEMSSYIDTWLSGEWNFSKMNSAMQYVVKDVLLNSDWVNSLPDNVDTGNWAKVSEWLQEKFLYAINNIDNEEINNALLSAFNDALSVDELQSLIDTLKSEEGFSEDNPLIVYLDAKYNTKNELIEAVKARLQKEYRDKIDKLSDEDLQIASELTITDDTLLTLDELKQKIQEVKDAEANATLANKDYADSISKLKESTDEVLKNSDIFKSAIEKQKNGENLNYDEIASLIELDPSIASNVQKTADGYSIAIQTLIDANKSYVQANGIQDIQGSINQTRIDIANAQNRISQLRDKQSEIDDVENLREIEKEIDTLTTTITNGEKAIKFYQLAFKELADNISKIPSITSSDLTFGYELLNSTTEEFNNNGAISLSTLQKITDAYPELNNAVNQYLQGIISEKELIEQLSDAYDVDRENYYKCLLVKLGYNEDYVIAAFEGEDGIVKYFADSYKIDLKNFKTYIEKKQAVQAAFDSYVAGGISAYWTEENGWTDEFLGLSDHTKSEISDIVSQYQNALEELEGFSLPDSKFNIDLQGIKDRVYSSLKTDSSSSNSTSHSSEDSEKTFDWVEVAIEKVQKAFSKLSDIAASTYKKLSTRNNALAEQFKNIRKEIELQQIAYAAYMTKANSVGLSSDLIEKVQNGAIDIRDYDSNTAETIEEYKEWYEKALDCSDAIQQLHEDLASLYEDKFNNIQDDFENQLSLLEHLTNSYDNGIDELEAHGYLASTKYYAALKDVEQQNIAILQKELADLTTAFSDAMASGEIDKYSDSWYDFQESINGVKEAIAEANVQLLEYSKTMREIEWEHFDFVQDRISQITQETGFLIDLMSNKNLYQDSGQLSDEGLATMGLHAQNYNVYMAQADQYADELLAINKELANDPNNTELIERREELLKLQQESILAAEDEKQAIIDMVEEGIKIELENLKELIDTYKDSLDSAKDLYEYQKKIEEKSKNIASLQKQLSAYENDTSEETRAKIQQIKVDLADAQEDLEETEYEQFISDTKELLDNLYTEYETILNERLDNVDALLADMIDMVNANAVTISDTLNGNTSSISDTLERVTGEVGYTMSEEMKNIWNTNGALGDIVTMYGGNFLDKLTTINAVLGSIQANTAAMIAVSNQIAQNTTQETTSTAPVSDVGSSSGTGSNPNTPSSPAPSSPPSSPKTISVGGKINAGSALIYDYAGDDSGENQYFANDPIYTVLKELNGYLQVRWHKLSSGVTGWFRKSDVKAYKTGGLVDYTGLAQLDGTPGKPEIVLNAKDTENFLELRDVLRAMAQKQTSIYSQVPNTYSLDVMPRLREITDMSRIISDLQSNSVSQATEYNFGDMNINIDHVEDYNDLVTKMQKDKKFEKMICSMTTDRISGGSSLAKNKYRWTTNK